MLTHPYFTDETVAKEQGIIAQEIKMYEDSPDWRLVTELCQCLYHGHPIRSDIAGTCESIARITPAMLYDCCKAFYAPPIWCWRLRRQPDRPAGAGRLRPGPGWTSQPRPPATQRICDDEPMTLASTEKTPAHGGGQALLRHRL